MTEQVVPSPCIKICALDENDICMGCYRNQEELSRWMRADNEEKQQIIENAKARELEGL